MTTGRTLTVITLASLTLFAGTSVFAQEIFHWIDEDGVPNFSQEAASRGSTGSQQALPGGYKTC